MRIEPPSQTLPGIDDCTRAKVYNAAFNRETRWRRITGLLFVILAIGLVGGLLTAPFDMGGAFSIAVGAVCGSVTVYVLYLWEGRRRAPFLRDILREEGRCGFCGYDLTGSVSNVCPECGNATKTNSSGTTSRMNATGK